MTIRERLEAALTPIYAVDALSRNVLFSANESRAREVGLDLANGTGYSVGIMVSTDRDVYVTIRTPLSRMVFALRSPEHDTLVRNIWYYSDFTMIPEGQLPVKIVLPAGDWTALNAYATDRGWR